jgi:hypothetical protein
MLQMLFTSITKSHTNLGGTVTTNYMTYGIIGLRLGETAFGDIAFLNELDPRPFTDVRKAAGARSNDFEGLPADVTLAPDGNLFVMLEEQEDVHRHYSGDLGFMEVNCKGQQMGHKLISKKQGGWANFGALAHANHRLCRISFGLDKGAITGYSHAGYYFVEHITGKKGDFIFYNDDERNFDREPGSEPVKFRQASTGQTFGYLFSGNEVEKFYLFGKPGNEFDNRFALLSSGSYEPATGKYAVLVMERAGRKKDARIAWVELGQ